MELKPYQRKVLDDLGEYLKYLEKYRQNNIAFNRYWEDRWGSYNPVNQTGMRPYKNNVKNCVHVCTKVPTAGGKTFIACNAIKTIFDSFTDVRAKAVVWLVPWSNLLEQTRRNLSSPSHPYYQRLSSLFNGRIKVYSKDQLLDGADFNASVVEEQLSVFVLSFSSLRIQKAKKEDRKIFQENPTLDSFVKNFVKDETVLKGTEKSALINVIRSLNPVLILDESHNAESDLSVEMLQNLNPSFILDLTATPKDNSNIISFVKAIELKKENMVKLPVIVYNQNDKNEVITNALHLQKQLERLAIEEEKETGRYIRPIVLFQAEPKTGDEKTTFEKLKKKLMEIGIPEEQIKIKTANINELKDINLLSKNCEVRFIITVNALKEGWDCPFAYVLASLADKSSAVDVEQILGRILRQPYVVKHKGELLNLSFVLTASAKFQETLKNIVHALNESGYSSNDYRYHDFTNEEKREDKGIADEELFGNKEEAEEKRPGDFDDIDASKIKLSAVAGSQPPTDFIENFTTEAVKQSREYEEKVIKEFEDETAIPDDIGGNVPTYEIKEVFADEAAQIKMPQFFVKEDINEIFNYSGGAVELNREYLLQDFNLGMQDTNIDLENIDSELYKIDLEETAKDTFVPAVAKLQNSAVKEKLLMYLSTKEKESQVRELSGRLTRLVGKMNPIADQEIDSYIRRLLEQLNTEQLKNIVHYEFAAIDKIKKKINALADAFAEKEFFKMLDTDEIFIKESFQFKKRIAPGQVSTSITKSLYERECKMNDFETQLILYISNLESVKFWHRNLERGKGFAINGYQNDHYPDFIVATKKGKIVLIETKGSFLDKDASASRNRLGKAWANKAGGNYKYFMAFDKEPIEDAYSINEFKRVITEL